LLNAQRFNANVDVMTTVDELIDTVCIRVDNDGQLVNNETMHKMMVEQLLHDCMEAMRLCIRRFQNHHYKAFYRLAQCYFAIDPVRVSNYR
jgi:hypothetical protein